MSTVARLSLQQYDRMIERGVFEGDGRRLEFIRGEICEMNPPGPWHESVVDALDEWSHESLPRRAVRIRVQNSIGLPELETAPQPDLAWVARRDFRRKRPTANDVLLVIEVSDSTLEYDTGVKADLYAAAGIADYWVVNIPEQCVEVRRDPSGGRYRTLTTFADDQDVRPLAFPDVALRPGELFSGE